MDPQRLLNMAETEEATASAGVDPTLGGDAHANTHNVSLTDNGSESGSSAGSTREKTGNQSETMEIGSPKFRIVDIEPRPSAAPTQQIQSSTMNESAERNPGPGPGPSPDASSSETQPTPMEPPAAVFAAPLPPTSHGNPFQNAGIITGKNIFSDLNPNLMKKPDPNLRNRDHSENPINSQKIPFNPRTAQNKPLPLPTEKPDPVEPDAVPSKIYDAILSNKKRRRKRAPLVASLPARAPPNVGAFSIRVTTEYLDLCTGRMSTACPSRL
jgi:hypothetical protein